MKRDRSRRCSGDGSLRKARASVLAFLLIAAIARFPTANANASGAASVRSNQDSTFDVRLEAAIAKLDRMGIPAVVAVSRGDGPIVVREVGAFRADGIPGDMAHVDLNSITKTVTAVMVMKLIEVGRLDLDETLADLLPGVPDDKASITVHQLLTHTAGIVESVGDDAERLSRDEFLQRAFEAPLSSNPGEQYAYSNVGYSILAAIIEVRSGKEYETFLAEDVLGSTGLEQTGYASVYEDNRSIRTADGRTIMDASWGGHEPYWNLIGNGGLVSTPEEFIRFRRALEDGSIVSPELVELIETEHVAEDDAGGSYYGYGLVVQDIPELGRIYWHDGGNDLFSAMWVEIADSGDLIFTAAADSPAGDAFSAMATLMQELYGVDSN